jgi:AcrR family transcriptional regulator
MPPAREDTRLAISRHAARLFVEHGVAGTSGDDIAAAAGLSTRSIWRHFRSKESCVEPLFSASALRFGALLRQWPRNASIDAYLRACFGPGRQSKQEIADDVLAVRLIAMLPEEPALRSAWLMSCHLCELELIEVISERLDRSPKDVEVRLCAATVMAAVRVVDETVSMAAIKQSRKFTLTDVVDGMAKAIRKASTLPICDPVAP